MVHSTHPQDYAEAERILKDSGGMHHLRQNSTSSAGESSGSSYGSGSLASSFDEFVYVMPKEISPGLSPSVGQASTDASPLQMEDGQASTDASEPPSPSPLSTSASHIRFLLKHVQDLPDLSVVKTACDTYVDLCGDKGTSIVLCYVDRAELDDLWLRLCSMQITSTQLAFLYAILANVGTAIPIGHSPQELTNLLAREMQERYIRHSIALLECASADDSMTESDASTKGLQATGSFSPMPSPQVDKMQRCHLFVLISFFLRNIGQYYVGYQYAKMAVRIAHGCSLFDLSSWRDAPVSRQNLAQMLQVEVRFAFNWLSMVCSASDVVRFDPEFPSKVAFPPGPLSVYELACARQKLQYSDLVQRAHRRCSPRHVESFAVMAATSPATLVQTAFAIDDELLEYIEGQHPSIRDSPDFATVNGLDRASVDHATLVILVRGCWMMLRWRTMHYFFELLPLDVFQHTAISSARLALQLLPLVKRCFGSPWQNVTNRSWIDGFFNQAIFIFFTAIQAHLCSLPLYSSESGEFKGKIRGELVWFMSNFNAIYNAMIRLGMVRSSLKRCATALKKTPVQIYRSSTTDDDVRDDSLESPPDAPIFQLLEDEEKGENVLTFTRRLQEWGKQLQDEYESSSCFGIAFSAHSAKVAPA